MKKQNKGITLIALVITIIVLLVLAGVAISMLSGENGILNQAATAKTETEKKSEAEAVKLSALSAMTNANLKVDESVLKRELDSQIGSGKYEITAKEDGWEIVTEKGNHYSLTKSGETKHLPWYYTEDGIKITNGTQILTLGDTVIYNPYSNGTQEYKSLSTKNGNSDQTFTLSNNDEDGQKLTWKVLGTDDNGNVLIMPTKCIKNINGTTQYFTLGMDSTTDFTGGKLAVQYGANEINNIASIYGKGNGAIGARSITEEDIAKIVKPTLSSGINIEDYGNKVTYEYVSDSITKYSWTNSEGELKTGTNDKAFDYWDGNTWRVLSKDNPKVTLTNTLKYYGITQENCKNNRNLYDLLTLDTDGAEFYWLGSTFLYAGEGFANFGEKIMDASEVTGYRFFFSGGRVIKSMCGIRPAVSLKSDIVFGGDATNGWTIQ